MGRPPLGNVKLSTWIPPALLGELRVAAIERGGSVGDAICKLHEQAGNRDATLDGLREQLKASQIAEKAALDLARRVTQQLHTIQKRVAAMSASTKARQRGALWGQE